MRNFKQLKIWKKGFDIGSKSFKLTISFPREERFGLVSQITRAAVSIPSNIAKGSSRSSENDYHRFIEIALGSSFELETQILISSAANFGEIVIRNEILNSLDEEQKMPISLSKLNK